MFCSSHRSPVRLAFGWLQKSQEKKIRSIHEVRPFHLERQNGAQVKRTLCLPRFWDAVWLGERHLISLYLSFLLLSDGTGSCIVFTNCCENLTGKYTERFENRFWKPIIINSQGLLSRLLSSPSLSSPLILDLPGVLGNVNQFPMWFRYAVTFHITTSECAL